MPVVIDGNNLLHSLPSGFDNRSGVRRQVLEAVRNEKVRITVVFDGPPSEGSPVVEHLGTVIVREASLALGAARILVGEAVSTLYLLGELLAPEDLLAGVDDLEIGEHAERGHGGADVHERDGLAHSARGQALRNQSERVLEREGLHVDDLALQAGLRGGGDPQVHVLLPGCGQQHVDLVRILVRGS